LGISVTDETLERASRVKRLIGRPQESAQPERKATLRYVDAPFIQQIPIQLLNICKSNGSGFLRKGAWSLYYLRVQEQK